MKNAIFASFLAICTYSYSFTAAFEGFSMPLVAPNAPQRPRLTPGQLAERRRADRAAADAVELAAFGQLPEQPVAQGPLAGQPAHQGNRPAVRRQLLFP